MKLYLTVIGFAMLIISVINIILGTAYVYSIILLVVICTALQFLLDGLIAIVINIMPDKYFGADNRLYNVSELEKRLYKRLKVRSWKDKVWELGGLGGFSKKSLEKPDSVEYIEKFIIECNKGVLTHRLSYPIGFLPMLFTSGICTFTIALPVALVNLFLNILPTLVLRYNTPKLKAMMKRMTRNSA
ncbi:MAG: hypothetical protein E7652_04840 [Ruminococcaceae bacterium]|nr:hypothetical protein [Oscillospiraceae bacterium]